MRRCLLANEEKAKLYYPLAGAKRQESNSNHLWKAAEMEEKRLRSSASAD